MNIVNSYTVNHNVPHLPPYSRYSIPSQKMGLVAFSQDVQEIQNKIQNFGKISTFSCIQPAQILLSALSKMFHEYMGPNVHANTAFTREIDKSIQSIYELKDNFLEEINKKCQKSLYPSKSFILNEIKEELEKIAPSTIKKYSADLHQSRIELEWEAEWDNNNQYTTPPYIEEENSLSTQCPEYNFLHIKSHLDQHISEYNEKTSPEEVNRNLEDFMNKISSQLNAINKISSPITSRKNKAEKHSVIETQNTDMENSMPSFQRKENTSMARI